MPVIEFTDSEKGWLADKQGQVNKAIADAEAVVANVRKNGMDAIGAVLGVISKSHKHAPPKNANLLYDEKMNAIGLIWGDEEKKFYAGELKISGAVVPPQAPAQKAMSEKKLKKLQKITERRARQEKAGARNGDGEKHASESSSENPDAKETTTS